jgi:hypothetical protein
LGVGIRGGGSYWTEWKSIEPVQQTIYSGLLGSITVSPSTTTFYQVTVYDNVTGCPTVGYVSVYVMGNDPSFSLTVNTNDPNYFTVSMVANDLNGFNNPGFMYGLAIQELDGAGNPYYTSGGTDCQGNYPGAETYLGFASTGTGTYIPCATQPNCGTIPGHFLYNHTYRFVRSVQNDYCPYKETSMTVTTVKSGNGYAIEITEDPKPSNEMTTQLMSQSPVMTDLIRIFPNPSEGIFTIALEEGATGAQIAVTNALGEKVKSFEAKGPRSELDMTGFTKGIYIVTIVSNGNTTTKKIVLE